MFLFKAECQPILSLRNVQVLLTQRTKPLPDGIGRRQCHRRVAPQHYPELFDSGPPLQPIILFSPGFFQGRSWHQRLLLSRVNAVQYAPPPPCKSPAPAPAQRCLAPSPWRWWYLQVWCIRRRGHVEEQLLRPDTLSLLPPTFQAPAAPCSMCEWVCVYM